MQLSLRLSPSLQATIEGKLEVELTGNTLQACLDAGLESYPDLKVLLYKDDNINPQILMFHNNTLIKEQDLSNAVKDGDVLDLIPAIEAG